MRLRHRKHRVSHTTIDQSFGSYETLPLCNLKASTTQPSFNRKLWLPVTTLPAPDLEPEPFPVRSHDAFSFLLSSGQLCSQRSRPVVIDVDWEGNDESPVHLGILSSLTASFMGPLPTAPQILDVVSAALFRDAHHQQEFPGHLEQGDVFPSPSVETFVDGPELAPQLVAEEPPGAFNESVRRSLLTTLARMTEDCSAGFAGDHHAGAARSAVGDGPAESFDFDKPSCRIPYLDSADLQLAFSDPISELAIPLMRRLACGLFSATGLTFEDVGELLFAGDEAPAGADGAWLSAALDPNFWNVVSEDLKDSDRNRKANTSAAGERGDDSGGGEAGASSGTATALPDSSGASTVAQSPTLELSFPPVEPLLCAPGVRSIIGSLQPALDVDLSDSFTWVRALAVMERHHREVHAGSSCIAEQAGREEQQLGDFAAMEPLSFLNNVSFYEEYTFDDWPWLFVRPIDVRCEPSCCQSLWAGYLAAAVEAATADGVRCEPDDNDGDAPSTQLPAVFISEPPLARDRREHQPMSLDALLSDYVMDLPELDLSNARRALMRSEGKRSPAKGRDRKRQKQAVDEPKPAVIQPLEGEVMEQQPPQQQQSECADNDRQGGAPPVAEQDGSTQLLAVASSASQGSSAAPAVSCSQPPTATPPVPVALTTPPAVAAMPRTAPAVPARSSAATAAAAFAAAAAAASAAAARAVEIDTTAGQAYLGAGAGFYSLSKEERNELVLNRRRPAAVANLSNQAEARKRHLSLDSRTAEPRHATARHANRPDGSVWLYPQVADAKELEVDLHTEEQPEPEVGGQRTRGRAQQRRDDDDADGSEQPRRRLPWAPSSSCDDGLRPPEVRKVDGVLLERPRSRQRCEDEAGAGRCSGGGGGSARAGCVNGDLEQEHGGHDKRDEVCEADESAQATDASVGGGIGAIGGSEPSSHWKERFTKGGGSNASEAQARLTRHGFPEDRSMGIRVSAPQRLNSNENRSAIAEIQGASATSQTSRTGCSSGSSAPRNSNAAGLAASPSASGAKQEAPAKPQAATSPGLDQDAMAQVFFAVKKGTGASGRGGNAFAVRPRASWKLTVPSPYHRPLFPPPPPAPAAQK